MALRMADRHHWPLDRALDMTICEARLWTAYFDKLEQQEKWRGAQGKD